MAAASGCGRRQAIGCLWNGRARLVTDRTVVELRRIVDACDETRFHKMRDRDITTIVRLRAITS